MTIRYLTQRLSAELDAELLSKDGVGYTIEQLMEIAGLSVAQAIASKYSCSTHRRTLVCCGPGNNGGDGLVAARHLAFFGYQPSIYYPKKGKLEFFNRLVQQCESMKIPILPSETLNQEILSQHDLIVDAIFGFGFQGEIRSPFFDTIKILSTTKIPIVSIDVPSGWDVERGNISNLFTPDMLVSLSAPKLCAKHFRGKYHALGGRFIPSDVAKRFELNLPIFPTGDQYVDL